MGLTGYEFTGHEVVDSHLTLEQALAPIPGHPEVPPEILAEQRLLDVKSWGRLDHLEHRGQIVVNDQITDTVAGFFVEAYNRYFPMGPVVPAANTTFVGIDPEGRPFTGLLGNDTNMMHNNVTSGFNHRPIDGTDRLSTHGYGLAMDVNPGLNAYKRFDAAGNLISSQPANCLEDPNLPGTFSAWHPLVHYMLKRNIIWGGLWHGKVKDNHHFGYDEH